jgi:mRNA-degrading endonuclease toxin of MazEF toxin-antitoxin module
LIAEVVRGGIYYADYGVGDRTVLVVSWNAINNGMRSPIICQVTRTERERNLPTFVAIPAGEAVLEHDSNVLCHEILTLDLDDFRSEVGMLPVPRLLEVETALRQALDIPA